VAKCFCGNYSMVAAGVKAFFWMNEIVYIHLSADHFGSVWQWCYEIFIIINQDESGHQGIWKLTFFQ
jgi:hypothetical protein